MAVRLPRIPKSKWRKHLLLREDNRIAAHLPETHPYSPQAAIAGVMKYGAVIIKPEWGEGGSRICKFAQQQNGFSLDFDKERRRFSEMDDLAAHLPAWATNRPCIVQRFIPLAPHGERPADIRTIVQKNPAGAFEVSGVFVKVAPPGRFVTNVKQGGLVVPLEPYLRGVIPEAARRTEIRRSLYRISEQIGRHLGNRYANRLYGIDIGIDEHENIWIIEVNTEPSLDILRLIDRRMLRRAKELQRARRLPHHAMFVARPHKIRQVRVTLPEKGAAPDEQAR